MSPGPGPALPWHWSAVGVGELAGRVLEAAGDGRPAVVAVGGHSSSGRSSFARA